MKLNPQQFAYVKSMMPKSSDSDILQAFDAVDVPDDQINTVLQTLGQYKNQPAPQQAPAEQSVTVTGQIPKTDATIAAMPGPATPAPQGDASQLDKLYQGQGPTAKRLGTSDPDLYNSAADQEYHNTGRDTLSGRLSGGLAAAYSQAPGAYEQYNRDLRNIETAHNTGRVKEAQALADKGLTGANAALTTGTSNKVSADTLEMKKKEFILEMKSKGLTYDQAVAQWDAVGQPSLDPSSHISDARRQQVAKMAGVDPKSLTNLSAAQLESIISTSKDAAEIKSKLASAASASATAGKTSEETRGVRLGNKVLDVVTKGGTTAPVGDNVSMNVGPLSLNPSPATTGLQTGAAAQVNDLRDKTQRWDTGNTGVKVDSALKVIGLAGLKDTGPLGKVLGKLPITDAAAIKSGLQSLYISQGMDPVGAQKAAESRIETSTPGQIMQELATAKATQKANRSVVLPAQEKWIKEHGDSTGFKAPAVGKFYDPISGDVQISDDPKGDEKVMRKKGYIPLVETK